MSTIPRGTALEKQTGYEYEGKPITVAMKPGPAPKKENMISGEWLSQEKKIEVATLWAATRNIKLVSDVTRVYPKVIEKLMTEPWFTNIVNQVVKTSNEQLDAKITRALDTSLDLIQERLEKGEIYVDKRTHKEYRVPVSSKTAAVIADIIFDKRQLIRGEVTSRSEAVSQDQRLIALKEQFEKFSKAKEIQGEVIHAEPIPQTGEGPTAESNSETERQVSEQTDGEVRPSTWEQINAERIS